MWRKGGGEGLRGSEMLLSNRLGHGLVSTAALVLSLSFFYRREASKR